MFTELFTILTVIHIYPFKVSRLGVLNKQINKNQTDIKAITI